MSSSSSDASELVETVVVEHERFKPMNFKSIPFDANFHPHDSNSVAVGLITGSFQLWKIKENFCYFGYPIHKGSVRCIQFSEDGNSVYTASQDQTISVFDLGAEEVVHSFERAHTHSINKIAVAGKMIISGDDDGYVKIWDIRQKKAVSGFTKQHYHYISDIKCQKEEKMFFVTSGDQTLGVADLRKMQWICQSDDMKMDAMSCAPLHEMRRVAVGGSLGSVSFFRWNEWDAYETRVKLKGSIDHIIPLSYNTIICGCDDGFVRLVGVHPNKQFFEFEAHKGAVIENMRLSHDGSLLSTLSHDHTIRFWRTEGWPSFTQKKSRKTFPIRASEDDLNAGIDRVDRLIGRGAPGDEEYELVEEEVVEEPQADPDPNERIDELAKDFITEDKEENLKKIMKIKRIKKWKIKSKKTRPVAKEVSQQIFGTSSAARFWSGF